MYKSSSDNHAMSHSQLHAFIDRAHNDEQFRAQLSSMNPNQIIEFAAESGFDFSDEIKGRFIIDGKEYIFALKLLKLESYVQD